MEEYWVDCISNLFYILRFTQDDKNHIIREMKITQVEPQKKTLRLVQLRSGQGPQRYNIYLDGQFAFGADEDTVVNQRLVVGKSLDEKELEKLLFETEVGKLMDRIYGLLGKRARSQKEISDYLKAVSFKRKIKNQGELSNLVIESVIDRLKKKGLLSDYEFAKAWIESRSKKIGPLRLKQELFQKGIDREIIDEVISRQGAMSNEEDIAIQQLEKKINAWRNLSKLEFRKKAIEYLLRRGFDYQIIKKLVEKYLENR